MTNTKYERLISAVTTVCIILLGIALIACTAHIYFTGGEQPYSRERVGDYLVFLAAPLIITAGLAIAGIIMRAIHGGEADGLASRTDSELLQSFALRFDLSGIDGEVADAVKRERKSRIIFEIITSIISALIFIFVLIYCGFVAEFTVENLNSDVLAALAVSLPLCAIAVGIHIPRIYHAERSSARELQAIKKYVKEKPKTTEKPIENKKTVDSAVVARYILLAVSIVLVILGMTNGGMKDVLAKAVKICTECIGLG